MAIKQITPQQAHDLLRQDSQIMYLDVRTEAEFSAGHPQSSVNIPVFFFQAQGTPSPNPDFLKVVEANIPKETTIIVGCQAGRRSQHGAEILEQAGYTNLANMMGGFGGGPDQSGAPLPGWRDAGLPVNTENGEGVSYASLAAKAGVKA